MRELYYNNNGNRLFWNSNAPNLGDILISTKQ